ncbi:MAG: hypothetical protein ACTJLL_02580 [Anaplasma sp.]
MPDNKSPVHGQVEDQLGKVIAGVARAMDPYLARANIIDTRDRAAHTGVEFSRSIDRQLLHKVNGVLVPQISQENISDIKDKIIEQGIQVVDIEAAFPLLHSKWYNDNLPEMAVAYHVMHQLFLAEDYLGGGLDDGNEVIMRRITNSVHPVHIPKINTALMLETIYFSNMECLTGNVGYAFLEMANGLGCVFIHNKMRGRTEIEKLGFDEVRVKHASELSLVPTTQKGIGIEQEGMGDDIEEAVFRRPSIGTASILLEVNMSALEDGIHYEPIAKITIPKAALDNARANAWLAEGGASSDKSEGDLAVVVKYHDFVVPFKHMEKEISQVIQDKARDTKKSTKKRRVETAEEKARSASSSTSASNLSLDTVSEGQSSGQVQQPAGRWTEFSKLKSWVGSLFSYPGETQSLPEKGNPALDRVICKVFRVGPAGDILEFLEVRAGDAYKSQRAVSGDCVLNGIVAREFEARVDREEEEGLIRTWSHKTVGDILGVGAGEPPANDSETSVIEQSDEESEDVAQQPQPIAAKESPSSPSSSETTPPTQQAASTVETVAPSASVPEKEDPVVGQVSRDATAPAAQQKVNVAVGRGASSQPGQDSSASSAPKHRGGHATAKKIVAPSTSKASKESRESKASRESKTSKESTKQSRASYTTEPQSNPNPSVEIVYPFSMDFQSHQDRGPAREYLDQVYLKHPSLVVADQRNYVNFKAPNKAAMKSAKLVAAEVLLSHFAELDVHSAIRRGMDVAEVRSGLATFDDCIRRGATTINGRALTTVDSFRRISSNSEIEEDISRERLAIHGLSNAAEYREKFGAEGYRTQISDTFNDLFNDSLRHLPDNKVPHQALIEEMINSLNRYAAMNISVDMRKIIERCGLAAHYVPFDTHEPIRRKTFITCTDSNRVDILLTDVVGWVGGYARTRLSYELHLSPDNKTLSYKNVKLCAVLPGEKEALPSLGLISSKKISTGESTASIPKNVPDDGIAIIRVLDDMHMDVKQMSETRDDAVEPFLVRDLQQYLAGERDMISVAEWKREKELCKKLRDCGAHVYLVSEVAKERAKKGAVAGSQSGQSSWSQSSDDRSVGTPFYLRVWNLLRTIGRAIARAVTWIASGTVNLLKKPFVGRSSEYYSSVKAGVDDASTPVQQDVAAPVGVTALQQPEQAASQQRTPQELGEDSSLESTTHDAEIKATPSQRQPEAAPVTASTYDRQTPSAIIGDDSPTIGDPVKPGSGISVHPAKGATTIKDESQQTHAGSRRL